MKNQLEADKQFNNALFRGSNVQSYKQLHTP